MNSMWHYLSTEDMQELKGKVPNNLYWKLSHQCRARIPMLEVAYNQLKQKYTIK